MCVRLRAASVTAGMTRKGATPNTTQSVARIPPPADIDAVTSRATAVDSVRGRPRRPMPAALTNVNAANPPVSASTPTPMGIATAIAGFPVGSPCSMLCNSSHSLTKPHRIRQGCHAQAPDQEDRPGDGHPTEQSAECVQIAGTRRLLDRAGGQEEAALEHGVEDHVEECGDQGQEGERAVPGRGKQPRSTHPQQDEAHVVGCRIGEEPFEIVRRGRVQGAEECGQRAHGHDPQPPPRGTTVEHAVPDPEDAVDPQVHHGRGHQHRHRAGRLGVGPGEPYVQRYSAGLGREAEEDEHEGRTAYPGAQVRCRGPDHSERLATRPGGQQHQPDQDGGRPGLGHHRIPLSGHLHFRPVPVVGQYEEQGGESHRLPEEEEGRHVGGRGDQEECGHEEWQGARGGAAGQSVPLVSQTVDHGADTHRGGDCDEEGPEPVEA